MSKILETTARGPRFLGFSNRIIPRLTLREKLILRWVERDYKLFSLGASAAPEWHTHPLVEVEKYR